MKYKLNTLLRRFCRVGKIANFHLQFSVDEPKGKHSRPSKINFFECNLNISLPNCIKNANKFIGNMKEMHFMFLLYFAYKIYIFLILDSYLNINRINRVF